MTPSTGAIIAGLLACGLLFASGFASGSEIAFFSLSPADLSELDEEKTEEDQHIKQLREDSERTLATILITNNLVNVTIIMLFGYFFDHTVNFGHLCRKLFYPFASIVVSSGRLADKVVQKENHVLSVDDLEQALELTDKEDIKDEQRILEGIVRFGDETAKEIMTSRQDVVDLDFRSTFQEVLQCIVENNYSRIPVYQDNSDNIRGILYIKDLLPHLTKGVTFRWQSLIRPPYFVPETKKIDDLLREFQENKVHIAIVVDEFGGTSGIVTLEDVLEEIVGEINDEYDEDEKNYQRINSNTYVFEGKTLLSDFYKILNLDDETFEEVEGDADTIAGLLLEIKGEFPKLHEKIDFQNITFEIQEMEERRISKVKVVVHQPSDDAPTA